MLSIRRCSKCELGSSGDTEGLGGGVGYSSKGQHFDLFVGWLIQDCSDDFAKFVVLFCLGKEHAHPIAALELHILMHPLSAQNCLSKRVRRVKRQILNLPFGGQTKLETGCGRIR